jgi:hypothetical protein
MRWTPKDVIAGHDPQLEKSSRNSFKAFEENPVNIQHEPQRLYGLCGKEELERKIELQMAK